MKREEEIEQAGKSYCKDCVALKFPSCAENLKRTDILAAYRAGAEWDYKTITDKAIKFFWSKAKHGMIEENINVFIEEFCKTMEE